MRVCSNASVAGSKRKYPKRDINNPILIISLCCRAGSSLDSPEQCDGRGIWSSFLPCQCYSSVTGPAGGGGSTSPHPHPHPLPAHMLPYAPLLPASTAHHMPQQATVDQIMQQAAVLASTTTGAVTTAGRGRQGGSHPNVGSTSLAALVPHVPQVAPPHHAPALLTPAAAKSEASAPSAGIASHTKFLHWHVYCTRSRGD